MNYPEKGNIIKRIDGNTDELGYVIDIVEEGILVEFLGRSFRKGTPGIWRGDWEKVPDATNKDLEIENS